MKKLFRKTLVAAAACSACVAVIGPVLETRGAECAAPGPSCMAPSCCLPSGQQQATQQAVQQAVPGMYAQPPATGEFEGESTGYGIRGMGFSLPAIHFEGASMRLPRLFSSKSPARMRIDSSTAPLMQGMPAQFGMLPAGQLGVQQTVPAQQQSVPAVQQSSPETCIPPAPACTQTELHLRAELARKDAEIRQMQDRFSRLEDAITRLAVSQSQDVPTRASEHRPQPIVEAGYTQEQFEDRTYSEAQSRRPVVSTRATRAAQVPPASAPRPSAPTKRVVSAPRLVEQSPPPNIGFSYLPDEEAPADDGLGIWKGEGKRPVARRTDGSTKR